MPRSTIPTALTLIALALSGCSGGVKEGMPTNITEAPRPPQNIDDQMRDHAKKIGAGRLSHRPTSNRPGGR